MHKLLRLYNQNRVVIWGIIFVIVFLIAIINVLNSSVKEEKKNNIGKKEETTLNNVVSYDKQSESIISGGSINKNYSDDIGKVIDKFFTYCINHEPEKAYDMLSDDMKNIKYQNVNLFIAGYYREKFEGNKKYSFQSWSSNGLTHTYVVNIYEDMLTTGKSSKDKYIEEFITVIPDEDTYKINVNGYIGRDNINKSNKNDVVQIEAAYSDKYMDYEIFTFRVKNNTNEILILDTKENTKNTYLVDNKGNKFDALVYENNDEDVILKPQEAKTIKIKFSNAYRTTLEIKNIVFSKIVNYNEYLENKEVEKQILNIEL